MPAPSSGERLPPQTLPWDDRLRVSLDRIVATPAFRRWAARLPVARWVARRRARRLFDLCAGFVYSQVLRAAVDLRLFDLLADGPRSVREISLACGLGLDATATLLRAATSLDLLAERAGDRFGLGTLGAVMVGNGALAAMIEHHDALYADLAQPVELLRGGTRSTALSAWWPYAGSARPSELEAGATARYSQLMSASQPLVAECILDAWPMSRHHTLLDVGGGDGTFLSAVAARHARLRLMLFDLPPVAASAAARFAASGLGDRARAVGGDFRSDALPTGADVATLVRVVHDHDDATVATLLRAVRAVLPPRGTLLVAEPMAATAGAEPMGDAYFGMYLLAMGKGRPRTPEAIGRLLSAADFASWRLVPTAMPLQTSLIAATVA